MTEKPGRSHNKWLAASALPLLATSLLAAPVHGQSVQYRSPAGVEYSALADTGAVARAQAALAAEPRNAERFIQLGIAQSSVRQFREAIETFTRGLAIAPGNALLYRWRGHRWLSVREFDKAEADFARGAQLDSTVYGIWYHRGIVRFARGDFNGAADAFARALPRAPDAGELAGSVDWLWMSLARAGRTGEAQKLLEARPDSLPIANAYTRRLQLYRGEIAPTDVVTDADTGDVNVATLSYGLGNWWLVRGDTSRARAYFEHSVKSGGWPGFGFILSEVELARTTSRYPAHWWAPVSKVGAPAWEIMPQEAGPGEVILSKRHELGLLSNFAPTPFEFRGKRYASLEGFWQMMKYPESAADERARFPGIEWKHAREQVAQMTAFEAQAAGVLGEQNMRKMGVSWVTFEGKRMEYRSPTPAQHYDLIVAATEAKVRQNPEVQRVLLATGDLVLKPDHRQDPNSPPEWRYFDLLTRIRADLRAASQTPGRAAILKAARELIEGARYCSFITIGDDGQPQARVVDVFAPEADMNVWFATNPLSRKVAQLARDARATLLCFDQSAGGYVTMIGTAETVSDAAEKARRWKTEWSAFYSNQNRGDDYLLVRIRPKTLEILSPAHGLNNDPRTWRPIVLTLP